jgi:hypothetical protein
MSQQQQQCDGRRAMDVIRDMEGVRYFRTWLTTVDAMDMHRMLCHLHGIDLCGEELDDDDDEEEEGDEDHRLNGDTRLPVILYRNGRDMFSMVVGCCCSLLYQGLEVRLHCANVTQCRLLHASIVYAFKFAYQNLFDSISFTLTCSSNGIYLWRNEGGAKKAREPEEIDEESETPHGILRIYSNTATPWRSHRYQGVCILFDVRDMSAEQFSEAVLPALESGESAMIVITPATKDTWRPRMEEPAGASQPLINVSHVQTGIGNDLSPTITSAVTI